MLRIKLFTIYLLLICTAFMFSMCSSGDTTDRDIADIYLLLTEEGNASIIFKNDKTNPACDYELEIKEGTTLKLKIPETATGTVSSPMQISAGVYNFELHCDATGAEVEAVQNKILSPLKTYQLHAEADGAFEFEEQN